MGRGGAEKQLLTLVRNLAPEKYSITTFFFYEEGALLDELKKIENVNVISLSKRKRWDILGFYTHLVKSMRAFGADIIYGYLDIPNIFALLVGRQIDAKVIFGVRASNMKFRRYGFTLSIVYWIEVLLSQFTHRIITNSYAGYQYHSKRGFPRKKMIVIPNGIDTSEYRKDTSERKLLHSKWGISDEQRVVGIVGRLDPMKGHQSFLRMAAILQRQFSDVRFVCVGDGSDEYEQELRRLAITIGVNSTLVWAGSYEKMASVYSSIDILVSSSSFGEGFSNVIGEAMACEVPCVVTDVGDSALIVGETGRVVPPDDPQALFEGVADLLRLSTAERAELGCHARKRIQGNFSVQNMVKATEQVFADLVGDDE